MEKDFINKINRKKKIERNIIESNIFKLKTFVGETCNEQN